MGSKDRLPEPRRFQSVVEWQFPRAHRYWDDCGKLVAGIELKFNGLVCQGLQQDGFHFTGRSKGLTAAQFYWDKALIRQVDVGDAGLADAADIFWPLVSTGLSVAETLRLGHRTWLCYETASVDEAVRWLKGFRWLSVERSGAEALGTPDPIATVFRSRLEIGGRRLRLELNAGTTSTAKKEMSGVIVDVDIVLERPAAPVESAEFIAWNVQFIRDAIEPMFRRKQ